jgi:hypothetical protein
MIDPEEDTGIPAIIGEWYRDHAGALFEVVAIDDMDATIEIQHFDGTIEELDFEMWPEVAVGQVEPPEDWSGSMDMEREDYGVDLDDGAGKDEFQGLMDFIERP